LDMDTDLDPKPGIEGKFDMLTKSRCYGYINFIGSFINTLSICLKLVILITPKIPISECGTLLRVGK
jgi:hypothetical protein